MAGPIVPISAPAMGLVSVLTLSTAPLRPASVPLAAAVGVGNTLVRRFQTINLIGTHPYVFPDTNFGVACRIDDDCVRGEYCNEAGQCAWDDREGCDICKPCFNSDECGLQQACIGSDPDTGTPGGCITACAEDGACPGDSVCREVETDWGRFDFCLSPEGGADGSYCDYSWSCEVACRDDVPCPEGEQCNAGVCEDIPEDNDEPQDGDGVKAQSECSCSTTHAGRGAAAPLWGLVILGGLLFSRRRRI